MEESMKKAIAEVKRFADTGKHTPLVVARALFTEMALAAKPEEVLRETNQLLIDLMDVLQQSPYETPIICAQSNLVGQVADQPELQHVGIQGS